MVLAPPTNNGILLGLRLVSIQFHAGSSEDGVVKPLFCPLNAGTIKDSKSFSFLLLLVFFHFIFILAEDAAGQFPVNIGKPVQQGCPEQL